MKKRMIVLFLCAVLAVQGPAYAGLSLKGLDLPEDLFPLESQYHKVLGVREDPSAPGFLIFTVSASGEETEVEGLTELRKWIHEAKVIQELENQSGTDGVADGAVESIKGTGRGLANLVLHPIDSAKGIGGATKKLGGKIGGAFRDKEEGEKGDGFLSSTKREIAKKLGVDVYSRNELLQEKLSSLAKQQMGGKGIVAVATFLVPIGLIASAVVTVSNINNAADQLVDDKSRGDLYSINKDALLALGFPEAKIRAFLNHPYYTPREITYIRFYLEKLRTLSGSGALLDKAIEVTEPIPAQKFLHEMQIAADSMEFAKDAEMIRISPEGLLFGRQNAMILIMGYDYVDVSPLGDKIEKRVLEAKSQFDKRTSEIWNAGIVTTKYGGSIFFKKIEVKRMCLFGVAATTESAAENVS